MQRLLVVDDEPNIQFTIAETLGSDELEVIAAGTARAGLDAVRTLRPDAILLDVRLPDISGLEALQQIRALDPRIPVVIMTAFTTTDTAIEAMRRGALEYLVKPVDLSRLREVVARALGVSRLARVPALLPEAPEGDLRGDRIVGNAPAMQEIYKAIGRVAPHDTTVLLLGESGTGKDLVARAIYHYSARRNGPFLAINCAAIPETLLESELFGHERGAFTGAEQRRIGKFEQCSGGTIFLDEIGDMTPSTQSKALRLLQDQSFEHVGGSTTVTTDVRIIAATNQDLERRVAEGLFRADLYYRLNGFTILLPPLRSRRDDIPLLAEHFIRLANQELGKSVASMTDGTLEQLTAHDWPGNIREFASAIRYATLHAPGDQITADCLPPSCGGKGVSLAGSEVLLPDLVHLVRRWLEEGEGNLARRLALESDRVILGEVLRHFGGNQAQSAERLGISRVTLRAKLRQLDAGGS